MSKVNLPKALTSVFLLVSMTGGEAHDPHGNLRERRRDESEYLSEVLRIRTRSCNRLEGAAGTPEPDHGEFMVPADASHTGNVLKLKFKL